MNANEAFKLLKLEKKFPISEDTINKCFRQQAKENHPDITGNDEYMKQINEAHQWLLKNISKINSVNAEEKVKTDNTSNLANVKFNVGLKQIADSFISKYLSFDDLEKKKNIIYDFIDEVKVYEKNNITKDMLQELFRRKMKGGY